jgi:hypothetical protein
MFEYRHEPRFLDWRERYLQIHYLLGIINFIDCETLWLHAKPVSPEYHLEILVRVFLPIFSYSLVDLKHLQRFFLVVFPVPDEPHAFTLKLLG